VNDLREILDRTLRTPDPGEPPVDRAMRRGKSIRRRRRLTALAGIVVVAAVALTGYRSLSGPQAAPSPANDPRYVTVTPPGPGSPPNLVASGTIGRQFWHIYIEKPTASGEYAGETCFYGLGSAFTSTPTGTRASAGSGSPICGPPTSVGGLNWMPIQGARTLGWADVLAPDVAYVEIDLTNGQDLRLIPADCYGMRLVAFNALMGTGVAHATAYVHAGGKLVGVPAMQDVPVLNDAVSSS
jgi:hypothetical protein